MVATKQHGSQQALAMMAMDANRCAQQKEGLDLQLKHQVPRNAKCLLLILTVNPFYEQYTQKRDAKLKEIDAKLKSQLLLVL
jgi:hypothetical protein